MDSRAHEVAHEQLNRLCTQAMRAATREQLRKPNTDTARFLNSLIGDIDRMRLNRYEKEPSPDDVGRTIYWLESQEYLLKAQSVYAQDLLASSLYRLGEIGLELDKLREALCVDLKTITGKDARLEIDQIASYVEHDYGFTLVRSISGAYYTTTYSVREFSARLQEARDPESRS